MSVGLGIGARGSKLRLNAELRGRSPPASQPPAAHACRPHPSPLASPSASRPAQVTACRVARDRDSGRSRGFCHIEVATAEEADRIIAAGASMDGRPLRLDRAGSRGGDRRGPPGQSGGRSSFFDRDRDAAPPRSRFEDRGPRSGMMFGEVFGIAVWGRVVLFEAAQHVLSRHYYFLGV